MPTLANCVSARAWKIIFLLAIVSVCDVCLRESYKRRSREQDDGDDDDDDELLTVHIAQQWVSMTYTYTRVRRGRKRRLGRLMMSDTITWLCACAKSAKNDNSIRETNRQHRTILYTHTYIDLFISPEKERREGEKKLEIFFAQIGERENWRFITYLLLLEKTCIRKWSLIPHIWFR